MGEEGATMSAYPQLADPVEYRRLLEEHGSKRAVARALGCAKSTVDEWGLKHGVAFASEAKGKEASEEDQLDTILSMLRHPCTLNELADAVDRSPSTVEKWLAQLRSDGYNVIDAGGYYSLPKSAAPAE